MKTWELENLDFEIRLLYILEPIDKNWCKGWNFEILYDILEANVDWKDNINKFFWNIYYLYKTF